jgi:uncharacterized membrane protein
MVVLDKASRPDVQRLVPIDQVVETTPSLVRLRCTKDELAAMEPFLETQTIKGGPAAVPLPASGDQYAVPYVAPGEAPEMAVEMERIPAGEVAIGEETEVEATDGRVGKVGELVLDPDSEAITHFVLQEGHPWGKREITLPVSAIDFVLQDTVYLKLSTDDVEQLPTVPRKRDYVSGRTDIELVARVFDDPAKAAETLEFVEDLHRSKTLKVLNAAILVKEQDGTTSITDTRDLEPKKGRIIGAITGGLVGLLAGPVGVVVGALAGLGAGSLAAKWADLGFSDDFLNGLEEHLQPGKSAVIILVEHDWARPLSEAMADVEGVILQQTLTDELVEQLVAESDAQEQAEP